MKTLTLSELAKRDDLLEKLSWLRAIPADVLNSISKSEKPFDALGDYFLYLETECDQLNGLGVFCDKALGISAQSKKLSEGPTGNKKKDLSACDDMMFSLMRFKEHRNLSEESIKCRIQIAAQDNDHKFFLRLGRALEGPAKSIDDIGFKIAEAYVIINWLSWEGQSVGLAEFTVEAITEVLEHLFGSNSASGNYSFETGAVIKMLQRLKLESRKKRFRTVILKGDKLTALP